MAETGPVEAYLLRLAVVCIGVALVLRYVRQAYTQGYEDGRGVQSLRQAEKVRL